MSAYPPNPDPNQQQGMPNYGAPPPPSQPGYSAPQSFGAPPTGGTPAGTYKPAKKGMSPWAWCGIILLVLLCCCCGSCAVAGRQISEAMRGLGGPFEEIGDGLGDVLRQIERESGGGGGEDIFSEWGSESDSGDPGSTDGDDGWESPVGTMDYGDNPGGGGSSDTTMSDSGSSDSGGSGGGGGGGGGTLGSWRAKSLDQLAVDSLTQSINDSESTGDYFSADAIRLSTWLADITTAGDTYTQGSNLTSDGQASIVYKVDSGPYAGEYLHGFNADFSQYVPLNDKMEALFREMNFYWSR